MKVIKAMLLILEMTAPAYHFQYNVKQFSIPVCKDTLPKNNNDQLGSQISKTQISMKSLKSIIL